MKKLVCTITVSIFLFTGCKKKEKTEFNKEAAQGILPATTEGISQMFKTIYSPQYYPLYKFQGDCVDTTGDITDQDGDGYVKDATFTYDCEFNYPPYTYKIKGKISVKDYNDNDSKSGFYISIENFNYTVISPGQSVSWAMHLLNDIKETQPNIKGRIEESFTYQNATVGWGFDFVYDPDDDNEPWKGGTFNFDGSLTASYENKDYNLDIRGENLHYSENSNCRYPDSGKLTITDGENTLIIEFSCNTYAATFNGSPIGAK